MPGAASRRRRLPAVVAQSAEVVGALPPHNRQHIYEYEDVQSIKTYTHPSMSTHILYTYMS